MDFFCCRLTRASAEQFALANWILDGTHPNQGGVGLSLYGHIIFAHAFGECICDTGERFHVSSQTRLVFFWVGELATKGHKNEGGLRDCDLGRYWRCVGGAGEDGTNT